jgi:hypothetical protein
MFFLFVVLGMSSRTTLVNTLRAPRASGKLVVSPSVTKCDLLNLGRECAAVVDGGAEWLHFSVQDGRFTSKLTVGSPIVSALRAALPDTVFDVKLGVLEPERRVPEVLSRGAGRAGAAAAQPRAPPLTPARPARVRPSHAERPLGAAMFICSRAPACDSPSPTRPLPCAASL